MNRVGKIISISVCTVLICALVGVYVRDHYRYQEPMTKLIEGDFRYAGFEVSTSQFLGNLDIEFNHVPTLTDKVEEMNLFYDLVFEYATKIHERRVKHVTLWRNNRYISFDGVSFQQFGQIYAQKKDFKIGYIPQHVTSFTQSSVYPFNKDFDYTAAIALYNHFSTGTPSSGELVNLQKNARVAAELEELARKAESDKRMTEIKLQSEQDEKDRLSTAAQRTLQRTEQLAAMQTVNDVKALTNRYESIEKTIASLTDANATDQASFDTLLSQYNEASSQLESADQEIDKTDKKIKLLASSLDSANTKYVNAKAEVSGSAARVRQLSGNAHNQYASTYNRAVEDNNRAQSHLADASGTLAEKKALLSAAQNDGRKLNFDRKHLETSNIEQLKKRGTAVKKRIDEREQFIAECKTDLKEISDKIELLATQK